jgi:DNA-binding NtrC family response regulator
MNEAGCWVSCDIANLRWVDSSGHRGQLCSIQGYQNARSMARVLAVDDDHGILDLIRRAAEAKGHQVELADTGARFMTAYSRMNPDVVIVDVVMPDVDGIELIRWLADVQSTARIIVISGDGPVLYAQMAGMLAEARGLGTVSVLAKPFRAADLCDAISNA